MHEYWVKAGNSITPYNLIAKLMWYFMDHAECSNLMITIVEKIIFMVNSKTSFSYLIISTHTLCSMDKYWSFSSTVLSQFI